MNGLVYKIQRFAVHDGPGIRTLVHMKGCPLKCVWCSSPESQGRNPQLMHILAHCTSCGTCIPSCPNEVISIDEHGVPQMAWEKCEHDGQCVDACPHQARELSGKFYTVEELYQEVAKDSPFYRRSNGGVTVGGGEPTLQHEFVDAFLQRCKKSYIHTAIETCGFVKWEFLEPLLVNLDLVYMDVKHMDSGVHREITGVPNDRILENVRKTAEMRPLVIRIPTIPGLNDTVENIMATANFAAELGDKLQRIELLPFHEFGSHTYSQIGMEYQIEEIKPPSEEHMESLRLIVESCGVTGQVGG
jgi:pyruvate formate lyase activating enzyme